MNSGNLFATASKDYQKGNYFKSLEALNRIIDTQQDVKTYVLLAKNLAKLGFRREAADAYALAGKLDSQSESYYTREAALLYFACKEEDLALLHGLRVMHMAQNDAELAHMLTAIYLKQGRRDIISPFRKVLSESSNPDHVLMAVHALSDSIFDPTNEVLVRNLFKRLPHLPAMRLLSLVFAREICDYDRVDTLFKPIAELIAKGQLDFLAKDNPFYNLHWTGDERLNALASRSPHMRLDEMAAKRRAVPHRWGEKIRIGYMSADFWEDHATMKLLQRILELHDRDRFDITLFCHSQEKYLDANKADRSAWGNICVIRDMSDEEAAKAIREREIDILVDLKGHTTDGRVHILNQGVAPVQVAWLGFPGSIVNIDLDYVIGDPVVLPESSKPYYHEKFVRLPESYQPNDPMHRPKPKPVTRAELGLPDDAFVFATFNGNRKITAEALDLWCNILKRVPGSVLWFMLSSQRVKPNVLNFMTKRGISSNRIVFCDRVSYDKHIDRLQAADLGLDTFPVNGHTTTSEQLWGGLPVLTVKGTNFASRVSESLLKAIGMPDLVAADIQAYEDMAVTLAKTPGATAALKQRLKQNAPIMPLFDADRFRQHLESAYEMIYARARQGLSPDHLDVAALPARTEPFYDPS